MSDNINPAGNRISRLFERFSRERVRLELLNRDNRFLEDAGFSRELLLEGVRAWPWKALSADDENHRHVVEPHRRRLELNEAIQKLAGAAAVLKRYTDRELAELGLSRGLLADCAAIRSPDDKRVFD